MATRPALSARPLLRVLGAGALLASGGIHLDLYVTSYHAIPTIGPLFLVQTISALLLGLVLLIFAEQLIPALGALLAIGTLGGYLLSRAVGLFGFHEVATNAGLAAGLLDTVAFVLLGYVAISSPSPAMLESPRSVAPGRQIGPMLSSRGIRLALPVIGVAALALALIGGIGSSGTTAPTTNAWTSATGSVTIEINNFAFIPARITVSPGERILVHNEDPVTHTLTAVPGSSPFGNFNTGDVAQGQTKSVTAPTKAGTYQYFCAIHNFMTGVITVKPK